MDALLASLFQMERLALLLLVTLGAMVLLITALVFALSFRLRRREGERWRRIAHVIQPRSAYHLAGEARHVWEHSIPEHRWLRYALTFRTLAEV